MSSPAPDYPSFPMDDADEDGPDQHDEEPQE